MGRTEKSQGLAPPAVRKSARAKQARYIVNKVVPAILASDTRARKGAEGSELIVDPPAFLPARAETRKAQDEEELQHVKQKDSAKRIARGKKKSQGRNLKRSSEDDSSCPTLKTDPASWTPGLGVAFPRRSEPKIRITNTDTLSAAHMLTYPGSPSTIKDVTTSRNTCILNMASPLRPGGGVLSGATSQEESLCARTTLLPSLKEHFYRLPEFGGVFTRDVLVFRRPGLSLGDPKGELRGLGKNGRWRVDVVSAGMLRFPELEDGRLGRRDREVVERKMRAVLRIVRDKGCTSVVLGAWGCGAYGNPVRDVAEAWGRVLAFPYWGRGEKGKDGRTKGESWGGIEEVVFAIPSKGMATEFAACLGGDVQVEAGSGADEDEGSEDDEDDEDEGVAELRSKIEEMEGQLAGVWNPDLKARMLAILESLRAQLKQRGVGDSSLEEGDGDITHSVGSRRDGAMESSEGSEDSSQEFSDAEGEVGGTDDESEGAVTSSVVK